jgi:hypothetical protein
VAATYEGGEKGEMLIPSFGRWLLIFGMGSATYMIIYFATLCHLCDPYWSTLGVWSRVLDLVFYVFLALMVLALALLLLADTRAWLKEPPRRRRR